MSQYLQTPRSRVGSVGKLPPGQLAGSTLVTRDPTGQEALVAGAVSDGVGGGAWQAEQHRVIGQAHIGQAHSHPLAVEIAGPGLFALLRLAREGTADKGGQKTKSEMCGQLEPSCCALPTLLHKTPFLISQKTGAAVHNNLCLDLSPFSVCCFEDNTALCCRDIKLVFHLLLLLLRYTSQKK